jgi:alkylation response protein AidB-like acyl-CoA dehydrogenase
MNPLPAHLIGGNFLLTETDADLVFTPEDLSDDQRLMAETAEKFMDKEVMPNLDALERQEEGLTLKLFRRAGELGLLGMEVPEEYGGLGLGKTSMLGVEQQLVRLGGFGLTCAVHCGIAAQPLLYFGGPRHKEKYLAKMAAGEIMGAYALSEAGSGSDALSLRTKATLSPDGRHYVLNGTKMWITNAAWADLFTVFAKVDGQHVTAFLVERNFPGVSTGKEEHKLGIKASSTRRLILEDAQVPVENVLGEVGKGAYIAFNTLNGGRFKLGSGAIGSARAALRVAARYAVERQQFGKPIASFGLIQQKLGDMAARVFGGESAVFRTASMIETVLDTGETIDSMKPPILRGLDEFALESSVIKVAGSEIFDDVADETLQIHGGYGFTEEFPAARACRDSRINRIFEGTNEINRLFIPTLLLRRAQRSRLPWFEAIEGVAAALTGGQSESAKSANASATLDLARELLANGKKLVQFVYGAAYRKHGEKFLEQQEVAGSLSDMIIGLYLAESALLRTLKTLRKGGSATVMTDMTLVLVNDLAGRLEAEARRSFAALSEGAELKDQLAVVRQLLHWTPLNEVALRRRIATRLCEAGGFRPMVAADRRPK